MRIFSPMFPHGFRRIDIIVLCKVREYFHIWGFPLGLFLWNQNSESYQEGIDKVNKLHIMMKC